MEKREVVTYVDFGTTLRFLQDVEPGWTIKGRGWLQDNLDRFLGYVLELNLTVTQRTQAYQELLDFMAEFYVTEDEDAVISEEQAVLLNATILDVKKTLFAEAEGKVAFVTVEKRLDIRKLLDDVRALVTPDAYDRIDEIAQRDLDEAGKCIAFERSTAAAFHLIRATEGVLRQFYCDWVKRQRVSPLLWDPMVKSLESRRKPPPRPLLQNLTNIRQSFRNPTQHPEKTYDIEEVQDLFSLCVDVIRRMVALMSPPS